MDKSNNILIDAAITPPKTSEEIVKHIADKVKTQPGKITTLLIKTKRNETVQTIPGTEWGGKVNKYVLKTHYKKGDK